MAEPRAERPAMHDYGVDTPAWSALPWSWAAERLVGARNYWVVTASVDGRPHAMPVWGVWHDAEARFMFSCSPNARKARNLSANPGAVVMTESTVECVSVEGRARELTAADRREAWIDRYVTKYKPMAPTLDGDFLRAHLIMEFEPERAFGVIEREDEFACRATRWVF